MTYPPISISVRATQHSPPTAASPTHVSTPKWARLFGRLPRWKLCVLPSVWTPQLLGLLGRLHGPHRTQQHRQPRHQQWPLVTGMSSVHVPLKHNAGSFRRVLQTFLVSSVHTLRSLLSICAHTFQPSLLNQETEHRGPADALDVGIRETPDTARRTAVRV